MVFVWLHNEVGSKLFWNVVQALGSLNGGSSAIDLLIDDTKTNARGFDTSTVCHVHISANA